MIRTFAFLLGALLLAPSAGLADSPDHAGPLGIPSHFRSFTALAPTQRLSVSLGGGLFLGTDFLYTGSNTTALSGSLTGGVAILGPLDAFLSLSGATMTNSLATPTTLGTGTTGRLGARLHFDLGLVSLAAAAALTWSAPFSSGGEGTGLGGAGWLLASLDLHKSAPLLLHVGLGYRNDAGSTLSTQRFGLFATTAQDLWQFNVFDVSLAADVPLGAVTPFVEYTIETPVGPGAPLYAAPHRLAPGVRVSLPAGFALTAGVELGLTPQTAQGVPTAPPYTARLAVTWSGVGALTPSGGGDETPVEPDAASTSTAVATASAPKDSDGDGIDDAKDKCPNGAEDADGFQDDDGCADPDNDGDGVLDKDDSCPNASGSKESKGCADADGDGIADDVDECPKVKGVKGFGGCPEYKQIIVTASKIELKQRIFFAFGKTTILPKSFPLLDEVVRALNDRIGLCVRIEGHTDNVGNEAQNVSLSQGRADAVRQYCTDHSVVAERTSAKGYGSSLPLETNGTIEGREANRRVEFVIVPCAGDK